MKFHRRATNRGADQVNITLSGGDTVMTWELDQLGIHCEATFTDASTVKIYFKSHESTKYDVLMLQSSMATANGVLNNLMWVPDRPINFTGKDSLAIVFSGVSSGLQWTYNAVIDAK